MSSDPDQDAVLADDSARILVTAPPGSGKTHTAVRLLARDVEAGRIGPTQRGLVLTFSLHARSQLERYANALLETDQRARLEITNYHRWFWSKTRAFRTSLGLPLDLEVSTQAEHREDVAAAGLAAGLAEDELTDDHARAHEFAIPGARPTRLSGPLSRETDVAAALADRHRAAARVHYDDMAYYAWRLIDGSSRLRRLWAHKYPVIVLDEYQDSSPLQAMIAERLAAEGCRIYAFADPLQMIYEFRDASKDRIDEFAARGASRHELRTLHRYRNRPQLRAWMQGVRDVLLEDATSCPPPPPEVSVIHYSRTDNKIRGEPYDTHSRDLWRLESPISGALNDPSIRTVAVLLRKHAHFARVEARLSERFYPKRLRTAEETAEWGKEWLADYASATSPALLASHLLEVAARVAPRNSDIADLRTRTDATGVRMARLRDPGKRALAESINEQLPHCATLAGHLAAARRVAHLAAAHEDDKRVASDALFVVRQCFTCPAEVDDSDAQERAARRLTRLRFLVEDDARAGLYLLTSHQSKGKEFDVVVIPYLTADIFRDDAESRQLLYVSLTRARSGLIVRAAEDHLPDFARTIGFG